MDDIHGYKICRELAQGVYTFVYEATCTHPKLRDRRVALKVFRHASFANHFLRQVGVHASLEHARIPAPFEIGQCREHYYMARMFIDGENLQNNIGRAARQIPEIVHLMADVASALDYVHRRGVIHGTVHPRHILQGKDGQTWLIGFGEHPPPDPMIIGNPLHFAPEQMTEFAQTTPATDVYGLAETALWLLCGRHPFDFSLRDLMDAKMNCKLRYEPRVLRRDLPAAVEAVLRKAVAPDPARRYASAGEFAAALAAAAGSSRRNWWFWK